MSKLQQLLLAGWIGILALLAIMSVFVLPQIIQPPLSEGDRQTADTKPAQLAAEDARRKLQNEVRSTLLQGVGALFTFTAAGIAAYWASRQFHVTREGQITDRFSRAIDQLASDKLDVQLGGIYALERIARDSQVDREAILQVLTTFVRERSPWPPSAPGQPKEAEQGKEGEIPTTDEIPPLQVRAPDIQAALTVLGRLGLWDGAGPLRLPNVDLRRADLVSVDLTGAILSRAHLEGANLSNARLEGADLSFASLLWGATLTNANLRNATLLRTELNGDLRYVDFRGAKLTNIQLHGALFEARLNRAELNSVDFTRTVFLDRAYWKGAQDRGSTWSDNFPQEQRRAKGIVEIPTYTGGNTEPD